MQKKNKAEEFEVHSFGCLPSKKDIRDYRLNKKVCSVSDLPEEFQVEHSKIKNQGSVASCVAHSVSEVLEQLKGNKASYSTAWIYGYRPVGYYQGQGMMTSQALKTVTKVGSVLFYDCPGNYELPQAKEYITKNLDLYKKLAAENKANTYARLKNYQEIKEAIFKSGKPVIVCISTGSSLELDKNGIAVIPSDYTGGHAVVCYGWNQTGLLIQNSWGEKWGKKGCFILPYEYGFTEAWILTADDTIAKKPFGFAIREFLVKAFRAIAEFFVRIFQKK